MWWKVVVSFSWRPAVFSCILRVPTAISLFHRMLLFSFFHCFLFRPTVISVLNLICSSNLFHSERHTASPFTSSVSSHGSRHHPRWSNEAACANKIEIWSIAPKMDYKTSSMELICLSWTRITQDVGKNLVATGLFWWFTDSPLHERDCTLFYFFWNMVWWRAVPHLSPFIGFFHYCHKPAKYQDCFQIQFNRDLSYTVATLIKSLGTSHSKLELSKRGASRRLTFAALNSITESRICYAASSISFSTVKKLSAVTQSGEKPKYSFPSFPQMKLLRFSNKCFETINHHSIFC